MRSLQFSGNRYSQSGLGGSRRSEGGLAMADKLEEELDQLSDEEIETRLAERFGWTRSVQLFCAIWKRRS